MMDRRRVVVTVALLLAAAALLSVPATGIAKQAAGGKSGAAVSGAQRATSRKEAILEMVKRRPTKQERLASAKKVKDLKNQPLNQFMSGLRTFLGQSNAPVLNPLGTPDYFGGIVPNYANSPLPQLDASGNPVPGTGIRKFVDSLPGLGPSGTNNLGQYLTVATPNKTRYPGSDYYVIALVRYQQKMHSDLPPTTLQGYVQLDPSTGATLTPPSYMGPTIIAQKDRAVRIKFINKLPNGTGGNLFLPVDTTLMGAGMGPDGVNSYTQNRANLHLHGGRTPWISDGTPHQWTTPANENTPYQRGVSVRNVPDMDGGQEPTGTLTFYYTNQQSARLMFYHDHSYGITRLNVYAGEAAPYLVQDPVEQKLVNGGTLTNAKGQTVNVAPSTVPTEQVPLVIQDKSFVPDDNQLAAEDPTWDKAHWGGLGNLWLPHVYMPNQNPGSPDGMNAMGRWDYGVWMFPPNLGMGAPMNPPLPNPLAGNPAQYAFNPGTPNPTIVPEAFMDTPIVNGTAYPYLKVERKAYRFRILNACNDRGLNLQMYYAKSNTPAATDTAGNPTLQTDSGEVPMVPAAPSTISTWPATWPKDGRDGGVPDPTAVGPEFIQIGNEGGLLPSATVLPNQPVGYEYFRRTVRALSVTDKTLYLGPAERADVIVDFSQVPAGSKIILYNDAPAATPLFDSRYDYFTGDGDQTAIGGAPDTKAGYGPNTRTVMQFQVDGPQAPQFDLAQLQSALEAAYFQSQPQPLVPEPEYNSVLNGNFPETRVQAVDTTITFTPTDGTTPVSKWLNEKAIIEGFDMEYGRMNAQLGAPAPGTAIPYPPGSSAPWNYVDVPTEEVTSTIPGTKIGTLNDGTQIWRIDHMGVDTHSIHFHLFDVQVINRMAIDGEVIPPDPNELGWKETIRMNPLVDTIVALRPIQLSNMPFKLGNSIRPLDPTRPLGVTTTRTVIDFGVPITFTFTNSLQDFGWEYVWHCHLLGHEENDMMRPMVFRQTPAAPTALTAASAQTPSPRVVLRWTNNWTNPAATRNLLQRATNSAFTTGLTSFNLQPTATSYADTTATAGTYYYRVRAENAVSYSDWSNVATITPLFVNSAAFSNNISYNQLSMQSTRMVANLNQSNVNARLTVSVGGSTWTVFNGAIANTAGNPYTFPAWNGKNPSTGATAPAGRYTWTLIVTKSGSTATTTGTIFLTNWYNTITATTSGGVTYTTTRPLVAGLNARLYLSTATASSAGSLAVRVTRTGGFNRVPTGTPWAVGPGAPTPGVGTLTGIVTTGSYSFAFTPTVRTSYLVTVIQ
jgi:FtsP/CotA-like multicopper oxidase with cupredoxin domain